MYVCMELIVFIVYSQSTHSEYLVRSHRKIGPYTTAVCQERTARGYASHR